MAILSTLFLLPRDLKRLICNQAATMKNRSSADVQTSMEVSLLTCLTVCKMSGVWKHIITDLTEATVATQSSERVIEQCGVWRSSERTLKNWKYSRQCLSSQMWTCLQMCGSTDVWLYSERKATKEQLQASLNICCINSRMAVIHEMNVDRYEGLNICVQRTLKHN